MSQITPYLRIISGGLDNTSMQRGKTRAAKPTIGSAFPSLLTVSSSRISSQTQADNVLLRVKQSYVAPGELHGNLNSRRALELLIN